MQHVLFPTRARGSNNPHTLDLVLTDDNFLNDVINLSPLGKSDHSVIEILCSFDVLNCLNSPKLNFDKGDYNGLREFLANHSTFNISDPLIKNINVNDIWKLIKLILEQDIRKYIPESIGT